MDYRNEIQARVDWIVQQMGMDKKGDVKLQIHADREKFDACAKELGAKDMAGEEYLNVLSPCRSGLSVELCHCEGHKDGWYVFAMPNTEKWTKAEKDRWIALNN